MTFPLDSGDMCRFSKYPYTYIWKRNAVRLLLYLI